MLQVTHIEPATGKYVVFADGKDYMRYSSDNWAKYYGMSLEFHHDCEHEEAAYQKFLLDSDT